MDTNKNLDLVLVDDFEVKQLELLGMDVSKFTSKKKNLTYLSWSHAWEEFIKVFPRAIYHVKKDSDGNAFFGKPNIGYMVFTTVTVMGIEREMWLLVMDGANNALKENPYTYEVNEYDWVWNEKFKKKTKQIVGKIEKKVDAIDMFDINKTIMRCLVKNLAMFGLGIYIYKGEDLPTDTEKLIEAQTPPKSEEKETHKTIKATPKKADSKETVKPKGDIEPITQKQIARIHILFQDSIANKENLYGFYKIKSCKELNTDDADSLITQLAQIKNDSKGNITQIQIGEMVALLKDKGFSRKSLLEKHGLKKLDDMTCLKANEIMIGLRKLPNKN